MQYAKAKTCFVAADLYRPAYVKHTNLFMCFTQASDICRILA